MRLNIPKQYALLSNKTVLEHTVYALLNCPYVGNVIVGVSAEDEYFDTLEISHNPRVIKGKGGKERSDTVRLNLETVATEYVMVHDAARPLISQDDLKKLAVLTKDDVNGAILACKVSDTLKMVSDEK